MSRVVGIDFGTTKTVAAVFDGKHSAVIPDRRGRQHIPSVVLVSPEQEFYVGWEAAEHHSRYKNEFISINSIKRELGHRKEKAWGWLKAHPQAVAALILGRLKIELEDHFGEEVRKAVIAIPAHYDINRRWAVKQSAELAGFEVVRMVNEATAAALAYCVKKRPQDELILVLDFGGGTLDASVLDLGEGYCEVRATAGDGMLGGDDFDQIIMDHILEKVREQHPGFEAWDPLRQAMVREVATRAKEELSSAPFTEINLPGLIPVSAGSPQSLSLTIDRETFCRLSQKLFDRAEDVIRRVLKDASAAQSNLSINAALLIGGASRIPAVRELLRNNLKLEPFIGVDPRTCVAEGAAVLARVLSGGMRDFLLLDTYPNSLSISTLGGVATHLIARNTTIPTRKSEVFSTDRDYQTRVEVSVYEGERPLAADNVLIGSVSLTGIPPAPRGVPQIEVTFDIDNNGILNVSARDLGTGRSAQATMIAPSRLSAQDLEVVQGVVAMAMKKTRDRLAREAARSGQEEPEGEEEAAVNEAQTWVWTIKNLLTAHGGELSEQQTSVLQAGSQLIGDYLQRGASPDHLHKLLASLKQEFEHVRGGLDDARVAGIARCALAIFEDEDLATWAEMAAAGVSDDESFPSRMGDFEARYQAQIKTIVQDVKDVSGRADFCDQVLARLQESPGAKHCFGLVVSHFAPRVPLYLDKIAEPSVAEPKVRALLILLLHEELGRDKSVRRRADAAGALSQLYGLRHLVPLITRAQGEAREVAARFEERLSGIAPAEWYAYYNSIEAERRRDHFSSPAVRARLSDALLELLRATDSDEGPAVVAALAGFADTVSAPALLDALDRVGDDGLRCQLISLLPGTRDSRAVARLLELSVAGSGRVRQAAQGALEKCRDLLDEKLVAQFSAEDWHRHYFAATPLVRNHWLANPAVVRQLEKALCAVLPEKTADEQKAILKALARMPHDGLAPDYLRLLAALAEAEAEVCCLLILILPAVRDRQVVNPLVMLLADERPQVRQAAGAALERCTDLLEPETERFIKIARAAMETGRAPSLTDRFFLSGYSKRHGEFDGVIARLRERPRH